MTTLSELLTKDKDGGVWSQQVAPLGKFLHLDGLDIVDGKVITVHFSDRHESFAIERDACYEEEYEEYEDFDEEQHVLFSWQQLFFGIDNFEHEFSVRMPFPSGGYELSCFDDEKGYLHQRYIDYSYPEAREKFIEYVANYRVPFY